MEYPMNPNPTKAPSFLHEFDSRVMPGRAWEPGMTISRTNGRKPEVNRGRTDIPKNPTFMLTICQNVMRGLAIMAPSVR